MFYVSVIIESYWSMTLWNFIYFISIVDKLYETAKLSSNTTIKLFYFVFIYIKPDYF